MLSDERADRSGHREHAGLNAPYGARCFLTKESPMPREVEGLEVLMHLMALGAF